MKYAVALIALAASVFALPQEASITSAPVPSASLTPQVSCALSCAAGDVTCQAACLGVARPNSSQAVASNECAAKCDQGDGSPADTAAYAKCQQDCFASLYPSSQTAFGGSAASAGGSATGSAGGAASTGGSSPSGTGANASGSTATGTAAQASGTGAANSNSVQIVGAGLAGLMAIFAL